MAPTAQMLGLAVCFLGTSWSAIVGSESRTYQFVAEGLRPYSVQCWECSGAAFIHAEIEGNFTFQLDFETGVGSLVSLNDRLVNFEYLLAPPDYVPEEYGSWARLLAASADFKQPPLEGMLEADDDVIRLTAPARRPSNDPTVDAYAPSFSIEFNGRIAEFSMDLFLSDDFIVQVVDAKAVLIPEPSSILLLIVSVVLCFAMRYLSWRALTGLLIALPLFYESNFSPAAAAEFHAINATTLMESPLIPPEDTIVSVTAISGDGSRIAGHAYRDTVAICAIPVCSIRPFTLSIDDSTSIDRFDDFHEGADDDARPSGLSFVNALSYDGTTSLVTVDVADFATIVEGQQRTYSQLPFGLGTRVWGADMSADGKIIVGNTGPTPFRWKELSGLREIAGLPGDYAFTVAAVSGDGRSIVINAQPGPTHRNDSESQSKPLGNGLVWTEGRGIVNLPAIPGDGYSTAVTTSFEGTTVVGNSMTPIPERNDLSKAVRWDNGELAPLGQLDGFSWSNTQDVSADGRFIVGQAYNEDDPTLSSAMDFLIDSRTPGFKFGFVFEVAAPARAVMWGADGMAYDLQKLLIERYGLAPELDGWQLTNVSVISDDGLVIAGRGVDPAGNLSSWVAVLTIPEPDSTTLTIAGLFTAIVAQSCRRRRGKKARSA